MDFGAWMVGLFMACYFFSVLELRLVCGSGFWECGVAVGLHTLVLLCSLVILLSAILTFILVDEAAAWPGVGFSWFLLFGSWGLLCDGLSLSGLPCSGLLLFGQGTWESMALGFMMQFLVVFSAFLECLWLNLYSKAFN